MEELLKEILVELRKKDIEEKKLHFRSPYWRRF